MHPGAEATILRMRFAIDGGRADANVVLAELKNSLRKDVERMQPPKQSGQRSPCESPGLTGLGILNCPWVDIKMYLYHTKLASPDDWELLMGDWVRS